MAMNIDSGTGARASIDVTPMIDILLVLLIIFMAIAPQKAVGLNALTPSANRGQSPETSDAAIVLEIAANGAYRLNTAAIESASLAQKLTGIYALRADKVLFVKASPELEFHTVAEAIDIAHSAAVDHVALIPR
jgi:biopolymer transport protein ExbD